ncbi:hypothetical protein JCM10212_000363 [Sporobolomyces blumeae]
MSISSPLPSTAFSTRPLLLTFSLERDPVDRRRRAASSNPGERTRRSSDRDVFEQWDRDREGWNVVGSDGEDTSGESGDEDESEDDDDPSRPAAPPAASDPTRARTARDAVYRHALSDKTTRLYPSANLGVERSLARGSTDARGGGGRVLADSDRTGQAALPTWLRDTSAKVNAMAAGTVYKEERRAEEGGVVRKIKKARTRVGVGCEDGVVWVFGSRPADQRRTSSTLLEPEKDPTGDEKARRPSLPNGRQSPISPRPPTSPPPLSPETSHVTAHVPPRIVTRPSSASVSTLSSLTSQSNRIPSAPSSVTGSTSTYAEIKNDGRFRKASATISISTASVTPSATHAHPHSSNPNPTSPTTNDDNFLPPLSPPDQSPTFPLSPVPSHPPSSTMPQFRFSSSTQSSRAPSPRRNPQGLASKKEARSPSISTVGSRPSTSGLGVNGGAIAGGVGGGRRTHSRAKESIANGIGLWQGASVTSLPDMSSRFSTETEPARDGLGISGREGQLIEEDEDRLQGLVPLFKVLSPGFGEVVGLEVVKGDLPYTDRAGGGDVLLVLRQSGHLSVISLVDGSCLGQCQAGLERKCEFRDLEVLSSDTARHVVCAAKGDSPFAVFVCLETLTVLEVLEGVESVEGDAAPRPRLLYLDAAAPNQLSQRDLRHFAVPASEALTKNSKRSILGEERSVGTLECDGPATRLRRSGELLIAWNSNCLSVNILEQDRIALIAVLPLDEIADVRILNDTTTIAVACASGVELYRVNHRDGHREVRLVRRLDSFGVEAFVSMPASARQAQQVLFAQREEDGTRSLELLDGASAASDGASSEPTTLYRSTPLRDDPQVTCCRKVDSETMLLGSSDGTVSLVPIASMGRSSEVFDIKAELSGPITLLDVIELGGREVVVAGSGNGMAGIWNLADWDALGVFSLFASPVLSYSYLSVPTSPHTLLFVSCNSPIALLSLHPPSLLFTLPGTRSPVELVATTREGEIVVLYKQGLARFWDSGTGELRRSTDRKTAEGVLKEKEKNWKIWFDLNVHNAGSSTASVANPSVSFDLRVAVDEIARELPWMASRRTPKKLANGFDSLDATPDISRTGSPALFNGRSNSPSEEQLDIARQWLENIVPFGVDTACDETLEQLGIARPSEQLVLATNEPGCVAVPYFANSKAHWTVSPESTARRLLHITCLLRTFLNYPSTERVASEAILYFASCLEDSVGRAFEKPSLEYLVSFWLDRNLEVQQAARSLFGTYLASLSDDEIIALVRRWQDHLPARQAPRAITHDKADTALLLIGLVAVDRFNLLPADVLKDLSTSLTTYLEDSDRPFHQAIATELCSRGFNIWQNYVDAMALVRQLFAIAIGRNPSTPGDLRALARQATVRVAGVNSPLFMSTLLYDILNAPTAVTRNATLKLLGFMIRKKPLVLHHSLPRVAEAVVKSLDPTVSDLRETVHQTATVILNELVRTFPSIDFHGKSQRLAVGTNEGSTIVYDLKTATRLYVLEGLRRPVTAVSWSTDGHRLVTVSLEESKVCVWRTGMGILSMIGAPTQRAGSPPFKEWDFHVGDEALMTTAATLEWVVVDWPADRTVRLRIRETALSFGA